MKGGRQQNNKNVALLIWSVSMVTVLFISFLKFFLSWSSSRELVVVLVFVEDEPASGCLCVQLYEKKGKCIMFGDMPYATNHMLAIALPECFHQRVL